MSSRILKIWTPEDQVFWNNEGKAVATRNLWISIPSLFLSFAVWMVWSVVVVNLQSIGFGFDSSSASITGSRAVFTWAPSAPSSATPPVCRC